MLTSLKIWYKNISAHCDPQELEQAILRMIAGLVILALITFFHLNQTLSHQEYIAFKIDFIFELLAILLTIAIVQNKFKPNYRKLTGTWLDIGATTIFMALTSDIGVMLVCVYLWVIFGNGFRYGKNYLYHAQALSIVGFLIATNISPYWKTHQTIGYSLILMLIILPLYVAKLITRLHEATHKVEIERQKAADASHAKTQFVANMSHEIRTPLNGIIGISTLLKTTPLNADQQDLLKTLESSSKLLLSLLNNVLDFTKIEERKFTVENVAFSAEEAIYDTIEIFRTQSTAKGIQLEVSIPKAVGTLKGDVFVLRQVLANLMGNAVKFTQHGSVKISATVLQEDDQTSTVRFEVADTGIGIPADKQDNIFESFTQADASTTKNFGGSGLGLTIAKHMVEAMGGSLNLQSTVDVGSHFWFVLTLEKVALEKVTINNSTLTSSALEKVAAKTPEVIATLENTRAITNNKVLNILVCEDESTNQKIITRLLSLPGHHVEVVSSGDELLDALEHGKFDLVITDLNMAGMSGVDALKIYRFTQPTDKNTRFILFTADATLAAKELASDAGFDAFLTKPIDVATLFNTIERVLKLAPNTSSEWMNKALNNPTNLKAKSATLNTSLDVYTLTELEKIGAGDDLFMPRLLRNYLTDSIKQIAKIETAVKQKRYSALQDYCHALKGNSLSVGAVRLAATIDTLTKLNATTHSTQAIHMLNNLNSDFNKLTVAIEDYLKRPEAALSKQ